METINLEVNFLMQILAGLIVAAIIGAATSMFVLYKCVHKQAYKINLMSKAFAIALKLIVEDTRKNHPKSPHITEIDKIYKQIIQMD